MRTDGQFLRWWLGIVAAQVCLPAFSAPWSDTVREAMSLKSADGAMWIQASTTAELAGYLGDEPPAALILDPDGAFVQPRLALFIDAGIGARTQLHAQLTADRGLDPGYRANGQLRLDEYFLQVQAWDDVRGQVRFGKFSTAFGGWVGRHRSVDNPLISAPLPYEDMITVTDVVLPASVDTFVNRRNTPEVKPNWLPVVWGPSYATGVSVSGALGDVDVTVEAKNASLSSRPAVWDAIDTGWHGGPVWTGRIGWRVTPGLMLGLSHSRGPYLRARVDPLPTGRDLDDYEQITTGLDLAWEHRRWQVWSEVMASRFEVPRVGAVDMVSAFVEVRYKFAPLWWVAGRWNRSLFEAPPGRTESADHNLTRLDIGLGVRLTENLLFKVEYGHGEQAGPDVMGQDVLALQMVFRL
jgi:hypothetical protein